ncbi:MAG: response regulator [Eubacteriales bacterium]|nr:response regulator [Eubacteriales bacterium]
MYTLLLVDDEPEIRDGLREVVPFEEHGFKVVDVASNGMEGYQKALELKPDLVITDIRMPLLDGLSMCNAIQKELPVCQFIIISGYDDFDYARQAIQLNTMAYVLKPVSKDEFIALLDNIKLKLDEQSARLNNFEKMKQNYNESLPLLIEMLLSSLISSGINQKAALERAAMYQIDISAYFYAVAIIRPGHRRTTTDRAINYDVLILAIMNCVREALHDTERAFVFRHEGIPHVLFLLDENSTTKQERLIEILDRARHTAEHYIKTNLLIGLSSIGSGLASLPTLALQASSALSYSNIYDDNEVLCVSDLEPGSKGAISPEESVIIQLSTALKTNDSEGIRQNIKKLLQPLKNAELTYKAYSAYLMEIMMVLFQIIRDIDIDDHGFENTLGKLLRCPPLSNAQNLLEDLFTKVGNDISQKRETSGSKIANEAQQYIQQNFRSENLNIESLCNHLHISSSYFSMVFKKETGKTFHQYLTQLRMDKAMTLLVQGDLRTSEVARQIGIPDPSYFSFVFKKHYGTSPSQVKRMNIGEA